MERFEITGGRPLIGTSFTPGSKNAVLPLLAATLLFDAPVRLVNVPKIRDVEVFLKILETLGSLVTWHSENELSVTSHLKATTVPIDLARQLRASILVVGPLLGRLARASFGLPGGDLIGRRPIALHLDGLTAMGFSLQESTGHYHLSGEAQSADIYLVEASVTATENLLLAAALGSGTIILRHAAQERHVVALAEFLNKAGLAIDGIGTNTLTITGRRGQAFSEPITVTVPPDELDAGTLTIAALLTQGNLLIDPYPTHALRPLTDKLTTIGADIIVDEPTQTCRIRGGNELKNFSLKVGPFPGFPTDLQPPMAVLATQIRGTSLIHDWMYERRFGYADLLDAFGAEITICDPHRILVSGPTPLVARHIYSLDIRAGIAFVLAALIAKGTSQIDHASIIERGYANLVSRLTQLGATVQRVVE